MQKLGISILLGALIVLLTVTLGFVALLVRARDRLRRARLAQLEPGALVRVLTPNRQVFHGTLIERGELHFWIELAPGDARLRVPIHWVSAVRRRAPRRARDGESESPELRAAAARRAVR